MIGRAVAGALSAVALAAVPAAFAVPERASSLEFFRLPSNNIACLYSAPAGRQPAALRCDILSGLSPEPRARCQLDWTGLAMTRSGRAGPTCAGDTVYNARARVLAYGRTWRRGGFACTSRRAGLRCVNAARRGFFLARASWRVF